MDGHDCTTLSSTMHMKYWRPNVCLVVGCRELSEGLRGGAHQLESHFRLIAARAAQHHLQRSGIEIGAGHDRLVDLLGNLCKPRAGSVVTVAGGGHLVGVMIRLSSVLTLGEGLPLVRMIVPSL